RGQRGEVEAEQQARAPRDDAIDEAEERLAPEESAERARHAEFEKVEILGVARRYEAVDEGHRLLPVDGQVEREEDDDDEVAEEAQAGHRQVGQRTDEGGAQRA